MIRAGRAAIALILFAVPAAAAPPPPRAALEPVEHAVCRLIEQAAHANDLPVGFMTRIIWAESSFRPGVVSPKGAEGIAQFMPQTAQQRGLANPFDPEQAIPKAAQLLAELRRQFGNLGIAAAAYNAGSARVAFWLRGEGELPAETRAYVRLVTERDAEAWVRAKDGDAKPAGGESCVALTEELRRDYGDGNGGMGFAPLAPWGVQLAGNFSKARALAAFERARVRYARVIGDEQPMIIGRLLRSRGTKRFYQVRLPAASRAIADALCRRIRSVGGACVALRS